MNYWEMTEWNCVSFKINVKKIEINNPVLGRDPLVQNTALKDWKCMQLKKKRKNEGGGRATTSVVLIYGPRQRPLPRHLSRDGSAPESLCQVQPADAMPSDSRRRRTAAWHELMRHDRRHGTALQRRPPLHSNSHHLGSPGGATVRTSVIVTALPLMLSAHLASAVHRLSNLPASHSAFHLLPLLVLSFKFKVRGQGKKR